MVLGNPPFGKKSAVRPQQLRRATTPQNTFLLLHSAIRNPPSAFGGFLVLSIPVSELMGFGCPPPRLGFCILHFGGRRPNEDRQGDINPHREPRGKTA